MMNDKKKQNHLQQVVRRQLSQDDMTEAFRSQYNVFAPDDRFKKLLEQLEQAESPKGLKPFVCDVDACLSGSCNKGIPTGRACSFTRNRINTDALLAGVDRRCASANAQQATQPLRSRTRYLTM